MHAPNLVPITRLARAAAVLLTLGLFTIGSIPAAGEAFSGLLHWIAHLVAFALIGFTFSLGWPFRSAAPLAAIVATIGAIHEVTQIITHSHALEIEDVIVNAIGALIGVAIQRLVQRVAKVHSRT